METERAPDRIFLQRWTGPTSSDWTWCIDRIDDDEYGEIDDEYIRLGKYVTLENIIETVRNLNGTYKQRCREYRERIAELEERVLELEGGFRLILAVRSDVRTTEAYRIAEEVLAAGDGGPSPLVVFNPPEEETEL